MYVCNRCGATTDEIESYTEWHGAEGTSNYGEITFDKPCRCGGNFVEAKECNLCGEWFDPDNMYDGICEECLKKETTEENAYKLGEECKESVKINGFLKSVFDTEEIVQILKNAYNDLPQYYKNKHTNKYCLEDITDFAERVNHWQKEQKTVSIDTNN